MSLEATSQIVALMHSNDPVADALGIELVRVTNDRVELSMPIDNRHVGGHGVCHGGHLFTLADVAMAYVSNRHNTVAFATHAAIDFVEAVRHGDLVQAEGRERNLRGKAGICDVTLRVDGRVVAVFRGNTLQTSGHVTEQWES